MIDDLSTETSKIEWTCMDDPTWQLEGYSLKPYPPPPRHTVEGDMDYPDYSLVITGDVFRWMINYAPLETLQRVSTQTGFPPAVLLTGL